MSMQERRWKEALQKSVSNYNQEGWYKIDLRYMSQWKMSTEFSRRVDTTNWENQRNHMEMEVMKHLAI